MMSNKVKLFLSIGLMLVLAISFVIADDSELNNSSNDTSNNTIKMNYGRCVSNLTREQNSCFKIVQKDHKNCNMNVTNYTKILKENNQTINKTEIKNMKENCRSNLKIGLESCKLAFKQGKSQCVRYKCKSYEIFSNNTCTKVCSNNQVYVNNTCIGKCRGNQILVNSTCINKCKGNEILINNTCTKVKNKY